MAGTVARRGSGPIAEMLDWLESAAPSFRGIGLAPYVRVEDFVDDGTYVLRAEMPGIDPDKDADVWMAEGMLHIKVERTMEEREDKDGFRSEFGYGSFHRAVSLPKGAATTEVKATYKDGVLEIRVPLRPVDQPVEKVMITKG